MEQFFAHHETGLVRKYDDAGNELPLGWKQTAFHSNRENLLIAHEIANAREPVFIGSEPKENSQMYWKVADGTEDRNITVRFGREQISGN